MKNLINKILESQYDTESGIPRWADFLAIDLNQDTIEYYKVKDIDNLGTPGSHVAKLKIGESYFDEKDQCIYVMLIDQSALNEK